MQAFTFLNYWKVSKDTLFTLHHHEDDEYDIHDDDDGPFFDLVFSLPHDNMTATTTTIHHDHSDNNDSDLFCLSYSQSVSSSSNTPFPTYSPLPSPTMLRLFSFSFDKSIFLRHRPLPEMLNNNNNNSKHVTSLNNYLKSFTVKFKVEEFPIIMSLFTKNTNKSSKNPDTETTTKVGEEGKKLTKERVKNYLKKVKPIYVHVSKRCYVGFRSDHMLKLSSSFGVNEEQRQRQWKKGLKGVVGGRHLGKSRSASPAARSPPPHWSGELLGSRRKDDSLVLQEDGIQGAILHCKRSYNASSGKFV